MPRPGPLPTLLPETSGIPLSPSIVIWAYLQHDRLKWPECGFGFRKGGGKKELKYECG